MRRSRDTGIASTRRGYRPETAEQSRPLFFFFCRRYETASTGVRPTHRGLSSRPAACPGEVPLSFGASRAGALVTRGVPSADVFEWTLSPPALPVLCRLRLSRLAPVCTRAWLARSALPFVFGVGVYCFEGMGMVLPIEDAMINRGSFTPILSMVMVIYTALCVLSGVLGYMAFGDDTEVSGELEKTQVGRWDRAARLGVEVEVEVGMPAVLFDGGPEEARIRTVGRVC